MTEARRLSQAISEGDGISVIVQVHDARDARAAEQEGAEGVALVHRVEGLAEATTLPVLWVGDPRAASEIEECDAHAVAVPAGRGGSRLLEAHDAAGPDVELVVAVANEEELELALELDAQIVLISAREAEPDQHPVDRVLELLPDVPAGKLAIADVAAASVEEVDALERAGFDAVLVPPGRVGDLVGGAPPQV